MAWLFWCSFFFFKQSCSFWPGSLIQLRHSKTAWKQQPPRPFYNYQAICETNTLAQSLPCIADSRLLGFENGYMAGEGLDTGVNYHMEVRHTYCVHYLLIKKRKVILYFSFLTNLCKHNLCTKTTLFLRCNKNFIFKETHGPLQERRAQFFFSMHKAQRF